MATTTTPTRKLVNAKDRELDTPFTDKQAFDELERQVKAGWDDEFPTSLINQGNRRGLSEEQFWWVHKLALQARDRCEIALGNISARMLAAKAAGVSQRSLKHEMHTSEGNPVRLSIAGPRSRHQGMIWVMNDGKYPTNILYGRIDPATGVFSGNEVPDDVQQLLREANDNPDASLPW